MSAKRDDAAARQALRAWKIEAGDIRFADSSHGEDDVRHNYLLDGRYVLRMNSAPVMNDNRITELNRLILRYRAFGLDAPRFLPLPDGGYVLYTEDGAVWYLSEYLSGPTAEEQGLTDAQWERLDREILAMTAGFAERYRDADLSATFGMYSLFDLSPYDAPCGIDEKQQNCDALCAALREAGEAETAEMVARANKGVRARLKALYPRLPRCVFQGDENGSNLCLNEEGRITGLFDFNMAGTDVCVNYLANHFALSGMDLDDARLKRHTAETLFAETLSEAEEQKRIVREHYAMSADEETALSLCLALVILFQWPMRCAYEVRLKQLAAREKTVRFLRIASEWALCVK